MALVVDKHEFNDSDDNMDIESTNFEKILLDVKDILTDKDRIQLIFDKYPIKGETREEYVINRAKRINEMLNLAGGRRHKL